MRVVLRCVVMVCIVMSSYDLCVLMIVCVLVVRLVLMFKVVANIFASAMCWFDDDGGVDDDDNENVCDF